MGKNCCLVAIVGPSASGKTSLANKLADRCGKRQTAIISQDQYYKDWSRLPFKEREKINFDHPSSLDFDLLQEHLSKLKKGFAVLSPRYSYKLHKRLKQNIKISAKKWILVDGLSVLHKKPLRNLFDYKIYVDIDKGISLSRRIKRDVNQRGETVESVCKRYFKDVLPMQEKYVQPQKRWADIIVNGNFAKVSKIFAKINNNKSNK